MSTHPHKPRKETSIDTYTYEPVDGLHKFYMDLRNISTSLFGYGRLHTWLSEKIHLNTIINGKNYGCGKCHYAEVRGAILQKIYKDSTNG